MAYEHRPTTDEINLVRLLRRLEKTVGNGEEWTADGRVPVEDVMLRVRKTLQTVKYARRLIKTVEIECEDPTRLNRLNDAKIQLDRIDTSLNDIQNSLEPRLEKVERVSLLSMLPLPLPKTNHTSPEANENPEVVVTPPLSIIPPDPDEISPSVISTALPSLLPINGSESAKSSAFNRTFGATTSTFRNVEGKNNQPTTALHEELSLQLEQMARQLKRNAIHFSESLANDKALVEDAGTKIESNFDVMQGQRVKLRDRTMVGWKNTCLVVGIVVLVVIVFMLVVVVIRFS